MNSTTTAGHGGKRRLQPHEVGVRQGLDQLRHDGVRGRDDLPPTSPGPHPQLDTLHRKG